MPPNQRNKVFVSYSHLDLKWLKQFQIHIKPLTREGAVDLWDDTKIRPGMLWKSEIEKALSTAKAAVLLVSPEFLASDFIVKNELPPILDSAEKDGTVVFPVLVKGSSGKIMADRGEGERKMRG